MSNLDLDALEALAKKVRTPLPWANMTRMYNEAMQRFYKQERKWWHGNKRACTAVVLIGHAVNTRPPHWPAGDESFPPLTAEDIPHRMDWYDIKQVIGLRWSAFPKRTASIMEGFAAEEDADYLVAAANAVPALLAEVRELRERVQYMEDAAYERSELD